MATSPELSQKRRIELADLSDSGDSGFNNTGATSASVHKKPVSKPGGAIATKKPAAADKQLLRKPAATNDPARVPETPPMKRAKASTDTLDIIENNSRELDNDTSKNDSISPKFADDDDDQENEEEEEEEEEEDSIVPEPKPKAKAKAKIVKAKGKPKGRPKGKKADKVEKNSGGNESDNYFPMVYWSRGHVGICRKDETAASGRTQIATVISI
jgi:hypothetical protein